MTSKRPLYFDTETTGTRFDKDFIIEMAAYDPVRDRTFQSLINPGSPIPPDATAIHGITDAMVADAPPFAQVLKDFLAFCDGDIVLIAHNIDSFDYPFLLAEAKRHNIEVPLWPRVDSLKWSRKYRSDLPKHSLQYLRQIYGVAENQAHRALDDVMVLYQVFSQMIDDLSMETVLELLNAPTIIEKMPFGKHQGKLLKDVPTDYLLWLKQQGALDKPENTPLKEALERLGMLATP